MLGQHKSSGSSLHTLRNVLGSFSKYAECKKQEDKRAYVSPTKDF